MRKPRLGKTRSSSKWDTQAFFLYGPDMNRRQLLSEQGELIQAAIEQASKEKVLEVLPELVQDARICCNSIEERFNKLDSWLYRLLTPYAMQEARMMLSTATIAYHLAEQINRLLLRLDMPDLEPLSLDPAFRCRLYDARNLLAEHYYEHMLYWRLTGEHTPLVRRVYTRHGIPEGPEGSLDDLVLVYGVSSGDSEEEIEQRRAETGNLPGGILRLKQISRVFYKLREELKALAEDLGMP